MHSRLFNSLLEKFHSPEKIFSCGPEALRHAGLDSKTAKEISRAGRGCLAAEPARRLEANLDWQQDDMNRILTIHSKEYPVLLSSIPDPPPLLYVRGNSECLRMPLIAMVGSRNPSAGGKRNARRFAGELVKTGLGVASGMAQGIDVESHRGALQEDGMTVAVLGTGIDRCYPAGNKKVFEQVAEDGALVSEFPLGTPPLPHHFPRRNRIISGLSMGVLVVEASLKSGSMITARFALEQGREVFAIPGSIHNPVARGCHKLISEGAKLVQQVGDITEECLSQFEPVACAGTKKEQATTDPELPGDLKKVLAAVGFDPLSMDALVLDSGLGVEEIAVALMDLELRGLVRRDSTGYVLSNA